MLPVTRMPVAIHLGVGVRLPKLTLQERQRPLADLLAELLHLAKVRPVGGVLHGTARSLLRIDDASETGIPHGRGGGVAKNAQKLDEDRRCRLGERDGRAGRGERGTAACER
jgi:hypothetical protein